MENIKHNECLPDEVKTAKDYIQYLDDIGFWKRIEMIECFYELNKGKYLIECNPTKLLEMFNNSQSDAHSIERDEFDELNKDWIRYCGNENYKKSPFIKI